MGNNGNTEFPAYPKHMYFNKILKALWVVLWPTAKKKIIPTNSRVRKVMIQFFSKIFCICTCKKLLLKLWTL